jgi:uncharacterized LabA/DUF88 family protein
MKESKASAAAAGIVPIRERVLVLVDEANVLSSIRGLGRNLDWARLRETLADSTRGQRLIEMVVYIGLPPAMPEWKAEREKKSKFIHWLRSHGFLVITKDGAPTEANLYKANVDVMLAVDGIELSREMQPDAVVLVTGDADYAYLALHLRRRGIRVVAASLAATLGNGLKSAVNEVVELDALFATFEARASAE